MSEKYFTIHEGDAGTEAFRDEYVRGLEAEVRRLREGVKNLHAECHAHAEQHAGEERENAQLRALADELGEASAAVRDVMLTVEPLREANWNLDAHVGLTLTVADFRKLDAALAKLAKMKRSTEDDS